MHIGIPKERKEREYRVAATPAFTRELVQAGHSVAVQSGAGRAAFFSDEEYLLSGASIVGSAEEVWQAELIIKVKEPVSSEWELMKKDQILFCFLHLAAEPALAEKLLERQTTAIAYETVTDEQGGLPLLRPMSEIAGRLSILAGASYLQSQLGGRGLLLGGLPGSLPANVSILGGGVVGLEAARMAMGLGADVTVADKSLKRLKELDLAWGPRLKTLFSSRASLEELLRSTDLLVGAVLAPGRAAPKILTREMIAKMPERAVFVDVSIDQGGCAESSRPTNYSDPVYLEEGVVHYCVSNMPSACSKTASEALSHATLPYALSLACSGPEKALSSCPGLKEGLNAYRGSLFHPGVAEALGLPCASSDCFP